MTANHVHTYHDLNGVQRVTGRASECETCPQTTQLAAYDAYRSELADSQQAECTRDRSWYAASEANDTCRECGQLVRNHAGTYSGGNYGRSMRP